MSAVRRIAVHVVALASAGACLGFAACSTDDGKPTGTGASIIPIEGGSDGGGEAGAETGALKKNAEQGCTGPEQCESNVCFIGGNQSFCTVKCTVDTQATICVAPFTGTCNKQGYCKRD